MNLQGCFWVFVMAVKGNDGYADYEEYFGYPIAIVKVCLKDLI